jgi:hypothetical protein
MRDDDAMINWLRLIRAEYNEIPGLRLTKPQVRRLWNLDPATCDAVLTALESDRFLKRTQAGTYIKVES